jgi:hypothetical protein
MSIQGDSAMHGAVARALIVVASLWTAGLQLFSKTSLAYQAAGDGALIDVVNVGMVVVATIAGADVVWRDVLRLGLLWPSFPDQARHRICVFVYAALAWAFGIRAFIAAGDPSTVIQVGGYYTLVSVIIAFEALALAKEKRGAACHNE